jgi:hypothetical protein
MPVKLAAGAHELKVRAVNLGGVWIGAAPRRLSSDKTY